MRLTPIAVVLLAVAASTAAFAETPIHFPQKLTRTDFQAVIADTGPVYVAGQPTADALKELAASGVTTVINLRTQPEMDNRKQVPYDEAELLKGLGLTYVHVPLGGPDTPYTPEAVEKVAAAINGAKGKVLLHCTVAWRASHMWAAYLVKYKGFTPEEAKRHAEAINFNGYPQGGTPYDGLTGVSKKPGGN